LARPRIRTNTRKVELYDCFGGFIRNIPEDQAFSLVHRGEAQDISRDFSGRFRAPRIMLNAARLVKESPCTITASEMQANAGAIKAHQGNTAVRRAQAKVEYWAKTFSDRAVSIVAGRVMLPDPKYLEAQA
jgi:hypothetical protein